MSTTTKSAAAEPASSKSISSRRSKKQQQQQPSSSQNGSSSSLSSDILYLKQQNENLMLIVREMASNKSNGTQIVLDGGNFCMSNTGSSCTQERKGSSDCPLGPDGLFSLGCEPSSQEVCASQEQNEKVTKKRKRNPRPKKSPQDKKPLCSEDGSKFFFYNLHKRNWYEIEKDNVSIVKMEKKNKDDSSLKKSTSVAIAATIHEKVPNKEDPSKFDDKLKNLSRICSLQQAMDVVEKFDVKVQSGLKLKELYEEQKQKQQEKEAQKEERRRKSAIRQKKSDQKEENSEQEEESSSPTSTQKVRSIPPKKPEEQQQTENGDESDSDEENE